MVDDEGVDAVVVNDSKAKLDPRAIRERGLGLRVHGACAVALHLPAMGVQKDSEEQAGDEYKMVSAQQQQQVDTHTCT